MMQGNEKAKSDRWIILPSKSRSNKYYYYNVLTKESSWTNPNKMEYSTGENSETNQHKTQSKKRKLSDINNEEKKKPKCNEFVLNDKQNLKIKKKNQIDTSKKNSNYQHNIFSSNIVTDNSSSKINFIKSHNTMASNYFKMQQKCDAICKKKIESDSVTKYIIPNSDRESSSNIKNNKLNYLNFKHDEFQDNNYNRFENVNTCKDKTLAQSRLLKKKTEYKALLEQKLKINKKKEPKIQVINNCVSDSNCNSSKKRTRLALEKNDKADKNFENTSNSSNDIVIASEISNNNDEENMDWEPLEEEIMIKHINCIRKNLDTEAELSLDIAVCSNRDNEKESDLNRLVLIFDTNIFISCLPFIKDIRDRFILDLGLPFIYIPWRVLQELDHLKNSKESQINKSARKAIQYINENFVVRHPRVYGQSLDEFSSTLNNQKISDDDILAACLHLKEMDYSKRVILITNDKNLESKALMSKVEAYSKDRLMKKFTITSENKSNESTICINTGENINSEIKNDFLYCKLKDILLKFLEPFLKDELKTAFKGYWETIVRKKPPWSLEDIINCLIIHWLSVFKYLFPQDAFELIKELKEFFILPKLEHDQIFDIIAKSKKFLMYLNSPENINKSYMKDFDATILEMELLLEHKGEKNKNETMKDEAINSSLTPNSFGSSNLPMSYNSEMSSCDYELCKEKVKTLFKTIWSEVKNYFCEVSGLFQNSGSNSVETLNEIKCQFQHTILQIEELLTAMDLILSLKVQEVHRINQIVRQFLYYLLNILKMESSELNNLHTGMIILCRDDEGRSVLEALMNDLKLLGMKMINIMRAHGQV